MPGPLPNNPTPSGQILTPSLYASYVSGQTQLSNVAVGEGTVFPTNLLATKQSPLHYNFEQQTEGYSTNGNQEPLVQFWWSQYNISPPTTLPQPSNIDFNDPVGADPNYKPKYTPSNTYAGKIIFLNQP